MAGAYTVSPGPLTSGKCPRQRRALERGQQDVEGYRMKFACYSPRVDYGQSSRPGPGPDPDPDSDPPQGLLDLACSSQAHGQPCHSALTSCPLSLGITNLPSLLLNPPQASRLRFSEKTAGPLSASLRPVSPKSCISVRGGTISGQGWGAYWGAEVWLWGLGAWKSETVASLSSKPLSLLEALGLSTERKAVPPARWKW